MSMKKLSAIAKRITRRTGVLHNLHHRKPTSKGGQSEDRNISIIPQKQHDAYHLIFSNHSPEVVAKILTERFIDPDYEIVARKKYRVT